MINKKMILKIYMGSVHKRQNQIYYFAYFVKFFHIYVNKSFMFFIFQRNINFSII